MPLDLPVVPLNLGASANAAPIRQPQDLTPAIAKMMQAYKEGVVSMKDLMNHGITGGEIGTAAKGVTSSLRDAHDDEIIRNLMQRGALGQAVTNTAPTVGIDTGVGPNVANLA